MPLLTYRKTLVIVHILQLYEESLQKCIIHMIKLEVALVFSVYNECIKWIMYETALLTFFFIVD